MYLPLFNIKTKDLHDSQNLLWLFDIPTTHCRSVSTAVPRWDDSKAEVSSVGRQQSVGSVQQSTTAYHQQEEEEQEKVDCVHSGALYLNERKIGYQIGYLRCVVYG